MWAERRTWFDEAGALKPADEQRTLLPAVQDSILQKSRAEIGDQNDSNVNGGTMTEKRGSGLGEAEVKLLADLLDKMLRYRPEDRISISEVLQHHIPGLYTRRSHTSTAAGPEYFGHQNFGNNEFSNSHRTHTFQRRAFIICYTYVNITQ